MDKNTDLKKVLDKQKLLMKEIEEIQAKMMAKQQSYLKLQGIAEYLQAGDVPNDSLVDIDGNVNK